MSLGACDIGIFEILVLWKTSNNADSWQCIPPIYLNDSQSGCMLFDDYVFLVLLFCTWCKLLHIFSFEDIFLSFDLLNILDLRKSGIYFYLHVRVQGVKRK